jgi:N-acetyl-beta-hexosaminidase
MSRRDLAVPTASLPVLAPEPSPYPRSWSSAAPAVVPAQHPGPLPGSAVHGPWTTPLVTIVDYPRYSYRGLLLDIARHYESLSAVEELISQRLTAVGGQGSGGTDGRLADPGGFWTQAQYKADVADAAAHFITVVPEVDSSSGAMEASRLAM